MLSFSSSLAIRLGSIRESQFDRRRESGVREKAEPENGGPLSSFAGLNLSDKPQLACSHLPKIGRWPMLNVPLQPLFSWPC